MRPCRCHRVARTSTAQLLPVPYYLVTFTVPEQLRKIIRSNQKVLYALLLREERPRLARGGPRP